MVDFFVIFPHVPESLFIFLNLLSQLFRLDNFYCFISSSLIFFHLSCPFWCWVHSLCFLKFGHCNSHCKASACILFLPSIFCRDFLLFIYFKDICNYLWKHFMVAVLNPCQFSYWCHLVVASSWLFLFTEVGNLPYSWHDEWFLVKLLHLEHYMWTVDII